MGVIYLNGFGTIPTSGDYLSPLAPGAGAITWSRQAGRSASTYSLRCSNTTSGNNYTASGKFSMAGTIASFSLAFALNHRNTTTTFSNGNEVNFGFSMGIGSGTNYRWAAFHGNKALEVASQTTTSETSLTLLDNSVTSLGWHWWNIVVNYHATTGYMRVYRDSTLLAAAEGKVSSMAQQYLALGNDNGGAQFDIGDLILRNDTTLIPDHQVITLFPTSTVSVGLTGSDGDQLQNFALVNENPFHDNSTYIGSTTAGAKDIMGIGDLPVAAQSVFAIQASARGLKTDAGARSLSVGINALTPTVKAVTTGGETGVYSVQETDGTNPWTTSTVNAAAITVEVV